MIARSGDEGDACFPPSRWRDLASGISSIKSLDELCLRVPYDAVRIMPPACKSLFSTFISDGAPESLRGVHIDFVSEWDTGSSREDVQFWDLSSLDEGLMKKDKFPNLEFVVVHIEASTFAPKENIAAIEKRLVDEELPRLWDAGILDIEWTFADCESEYDNIPIVLLTNAGDRIRAVALDNDSRKSVG